MRDLLPRLHEVDSYSLSGWAEGKLTDNTRGGSSRDLNKHETGLHSTCIIKFSCLNSVQVNISCDFFVSDSSTEAVKISKRNTEDSITAARQRFLERKRARDQQQGT